jgi:hypothetical protein
VSDSWENCLGFVRSFPSSSFSPLFQPGGHAGVPLPRSPSWDPNCLQSTPHRDRLHESGPVATDIPPARLGGASACLLPHNRSGARSPTSPRGPSFAVTHFLLRASSGSCPPALLPTPLLSPPSSSNHRQRHLAIGRLRHHPSVGHAPTIGPEIRIPQHCSRLSKLRADESFLTRHSDERRPRGKHANAIDTSRQPLGASP